MTQKYAFVACYSFPSTSSGRTIFLHLHWRAGYHGNRSQCSAQYQASRLALWDEAQQWFGDPLSITLEQEKKNKSLSQEWARDSRAERKGLTFRSWKFSINSKKSSEKGPRSSTPLRCPQLWPEERKFWKKPGKGEEAWAFLERGRWQSGVTYVQKMSLWHGGGASCRQAAEDAMARIQEKLEDVGYRLQCSCPVAWVSWTSLMSAF